MACRGRTRFRKWRIGLLVLFAGVVVTDSVMTGMVDKKILLYHK